MSRVLFLDLNADQVAAKCQSEGVDISVLERLPDGGTRLVCMSKDGASRMFTKLKKHLIQEVALTRRPARPLW